MYKSYFQFIEDPISSYTHFIGAVISFFISLFWIICGVYLQTNFITLLSIILFGLSLISLYAASSYYHTLSHNNTRHMLFRKLDHSMIYVLIVGSYTPFIVAYSNSSLLVVTIMWILALIGIIIKVCWFNAPRWLYTSLYIILGWSIIFMPSIFVNMPSICLLLVALGGIAYTIGGIIYIIKKPNLICNWTFHDIFHIFILVGSLFHILAVSLYIL